MGFAMRPTSLGMRSILFVALFLGLGLPGFVPGAASADPSDCVIDDGGETPVLVCPERSIEVRRIRFADALERLREKERRGIQGAGIYERYRAMGGRKKKTPYLYHR